MKNLTRNVFSVTGAAIAMFAVASCHDYANENSPEARDQESVRQQQMQYQTAQPIPKLDFSLERDIVIQLYTARNERVATHTVWRGDTSKIEGECPSIGYPIPYDTSLTNPLQLSHKWVGSNAAHYMLEGAVEQPEPNGVFASKNSIATWVRCVVDGEEVPVYIEGKVTAYPYAVEIDYEKGIVRRAGNAKPSVVIEKKEKKEK